jgi:tRNA(Ile2) C34 agmatinyltransferase TiaS
MVKRLELVKKQSKLQGFTLEPTDRGLRYGPPLCQYCNKNTVLFPYAPDFMCEECKEIIGKAFAKNARRNSHADK